MTDSLDIIDAALAEFASRDSVPADPLINAIGDIDPPTGVILAGLVSRFNESVKANIPTLIRKGEADPGVLHARDAINILLDLRNSLAASIPVEVVELELAPA